MTKKLILQLETATTMCSVALSLDGELLAQKELNERNVHASQITLFIDEVMKSAGKSFQDLDAISVSKGPGSYTGLRIGVSTAKGLCFGLDIPLISVNTLEAMAYGLLERYPEMISSSLLCPMIDARRMEVYTAIFDTALHSVEAVSAKVLNEQSFAKHLEEQQVVFFGDGAAKCLPLYSHHPNFRFIEFKNSAAHMCSLSLKKLNNGETENMAYFEPFYLKDFIAGSPK